MRRIAIYDLDRTLLSRATYTPFLIHAARQRAPWRLGLLPAWIAAMAAYKAGACSRKDLKQAGLDLLLGAPVDESDLTRLAKGFCAKILPDEVAPGARAALERDRDEARMLVIASAAFEFYAAPIGAELGFDRVIGTRHTIVDGRCRILGENCYGAEKIARIEAFLGAEGLDRADCHVRFYSDSISDAPLLDWSDDAVLVDGGAKAARIASARGWRTARFAKPD